MPESSSRKLKTVETSWEIIQTLEELDGAGVTELSERLELSKGAVYTHLVTLRDCNYVTKKGNEYNLALHFLNIGKYVQNNNTLYNSGKQEVDKLAEETEEYAHLVTEEHGDLIYLHEAKGEKAIAEDYFSQKFLTPGYLHSAAYGKAILAYLPKHKVTSIIENSGLPQLTENTITDKKRLFEELEKVRERGYALNDEEEIPGVRAVGAPIFDSNESVVGAISVSKPTTRMQNEEFYESVPELIVDTANVIKINMQI